MRLRRRRSGGPGLAGRGGEGAPSARVTTADGRRVLRLDCPFSRATGPRLTWDLRLGLDRPHGAIGYLTPYEFTGREPGLRPSGLTQEPPRTTLPEATQL